MDGSSKRGQPFCQHNGTCQNDRECLSASGKCITADAAPGNVGRKRRHTIRRSKGNNMHGLEQQQATTQIFDCRTSRVSNISEKAVTVSPNTRVPIGVLRNVSNVTPAENHGGSGLRNRFVGILSLKTRHYGCRCERRSSSFPRQNMPLTADGKGYLSVPVQRHKPQASPSSKMAAPVISRLADSRNL